MNEDREDEPQRREGSRRDVAEERRDDDLEQRREKAPEDEPGEPGAEGGSQSPAADTLPALPADDDSPLGDTDQHSSN